MENTFLDPKCHANAEYDPHDNSVTLTPAFEFNKLPPVWKTSVTPLFLEGATQFILKHKPTHVKIRAIVFPRSPTTLDFFTCILGAGFVRTLDLGYDSSILPEWNPSHIQPFLQMIQDSTLQRVRLHFVPDTREIAEGIASIIAHNLTIEILESNHTDDSFGDLALHAALSTTGPLKILHLRMTCAPWKTFPKAIPSSLERIVFESEKIWQFRDDSLVPTLVHGHRREWCPLCKEVAKTLHCKSP